MLKYSKYSFAVIGLIIFFRAGTLPATGYKTTELNRKMAEIASLQHILFEKTTLAKNKKGQLEQKSEAPQHEIRHKRARPQFDSYHKAILVLRIDYNLKLIRLLLGYTTS